MNTSNVAHKEFENSVENLQEEQKGVIEVEPGQVIESKVEEEIEYGTDCNYIDEKLRKLLDEFDGYEKNGIDGIDKEKMEILSLIANKKEEILNKFEIKSNNVKSEYVPQIIKLKNTIEELDGDNDVRGVAALSAIRLSKELEAKLNKIENECNSACKQMEDKLKIEYYKERSQRLINKKATEIDFRTTEINVEQNSINVEIDNLQLSIKTQEDKIREDEKKINEKYMIAERTFREVNKEADKKRIRLTPEQIMELNNTGSIEFDKISNIEPESDFDVFRKDQAIKKECEKREAFKLPREAIEKDKSKLKKLKGKYDVLSQEEKKLEVDYRNYCNKVMQEELEDQIFNLNPNLKVKKEAGIDLTFSEKVSLTVSNVTGSIAESNEFKKEAKKEREKEKVALKTRMVVEDARVAINDATISIGEGYEQLCDNSNKRLLS